MGTVKAICLFAGAAAAVSVLVVWGLRLCADYLARGLACRFVEMRILLDRSPRPFEKVVAGLAAAAGVPERFAEEFMECLCMAYGVPEGYLFPEDRFSVDLFLPLASVPRNLSKREANWCRRINVDLFRDFVCWYYRSTMSRASGEDLCDLVDRLEQSLDITVAELCRELHQLEKDRTDG